MIDLNDGNETKRFPVSEEDRLISEAKDSAFNAIKIWIENVTDNRFTYPNDFRRSLADGILLCNLLNSLKPGSIKRINKISTAISGYDTSPATDNIGKFLRCCEDDFGLSGLILFEMSDLEDLAEKSPDCNMESEKRLERVLMCLFHLAKSVENQLTSFVIDSTLFNILLKSQDFREMKKKRLISNRDDSVFDSTVPEIIQKQAPDYLANKANETLKQTQMNQEILKKSLEDDDWQESLENWREKRRQVLSSSVMENAKTDSVDSDNKDLVKLKEKARKMKQLRDQIKDQSIETASDQLASQSSVSIPDIDDETKAMIERVKQKKLAKEQKNQFSLSSPTSISFASDSELSASVANEKHEEDTLSISEKNESEPAISLQPNKTVKDVIENDQFSADKYEQPVRSQENGKNRIIQVKLSQRSKQDSDQLLGMDLIDRSGAILVSKVKIGSCSDVCDVRKNDEIVGINGKDVTNQSIDYVKSVFNQYASVISKSEYITLSLRRWMSEDEDDEFLCSDMSENVEDNHKNEAEISEIVDVLKVHLNESSIKSIVTNYDKTDNSKRDFTELETLKNLNIDNPTKTFNNHDDISMSGVTEDDPNYKDDSSSFTINNISIIDLDVPRDSSKNIDENKSGFDCSVQEKIAKFESQKLFKPPNLNSSWNASKSSQADSSLNTSYSHRSSFDGLLSNQDNLKHKSIQASHSSISNLHNYWETEEPKTISASNQNITMKSAPLTQSNNKSSTTEKVKSVKVKSKEAGQQMTLPNTNVVNSRRNIPSPGNSSTSDDVSALNEIMMPQIGYVNKSANTYWKDSENNDFIPKVTTRTVDKNIPLLPDKSNISTGIQADLTQNRQQPVYTTITTSFENLHKKSYSVSTPKISDDDSYSVSVLKYPENEINNGTISTATEMKSQTLQTHLPWQHNNKNDDSKDLTTVTSEVHENDSKRKSRTRTSLSSGSNVTGLFDNNEKSIEIEVSITPQLFPMRNKTLFSRPPDEKHLNSKLEDVVTAQRSYDEDENTLRSEYIKVTNLDDVMSPIKERTKTSFGIENLIISPTKDELNTPEIIQNGIFPFLYTSNSHKFQNENSNVQHRKPSYADGPDIDTEQSTSTVPAPTLFKSGHKSDNSVSIGMSYSKSDNINSLKNESNYSSRKSSKCDTKHNEGLKSKRSLSSKELRFIDDSSKNDWDKPSTSYREKPSHSMSNNRKLSPSQVTFSSSVQDITKSKVQTKTYSIEKAPKSVSRREKKKQKSKTKSMPPAEIHTKCNNCSQPAGSEDLMVIEELNLHFHLRCFRCSECGVQLGDGKSDTDVRIRRSQLHCATCYKKSSKSKNRNQVSTRQNLPIASNIQNKGGHGDGRNMCIRSGGSNNNCVLPNVVSGLSSSPYFMPYKRPLASSPSIQLHQI